MTPEKTQIANLIKLAKVDGELHHKEVMLIYGIAHKHGIGKFDMDEIISRADSIETSMPIIQSDKVKYFYQLLVLATVDHKVSDDEVSLLTRVGGELGLAPQAVRKAIDHVVENHSTDLSDEEISGIFTL